MQLDAVLFDLDGTLADTAPDLLGALNKLCVEHGRPTLAMEQVRPHITGGSPKFIELGFGINVEHENYASLRQGFLDYYGAGLANHSTLMPNADALIAHMAGRGIRWGIVTNKAAALTRPLVHALGLLPAAACLVAGDCAARAKPHPDTLLLAAERLALAPNRIAYVGDARTDIIAAHAAGMHAIAVTFGYIAAHDSPHDWGADTVIESLDELISWFPGNGL
ncbi:MAG: HAD-IA family hydrolase [Gammaproteobacteria bacterium]|nr:HAD-IA family hydrolase [Gammaproteobacteria bacterium]